MLSKITDRLSDGGAEAWMIVLFFVGIFALAIRIVCFPTEDEGREERNFLFFRKGRK